MGFGISKKFIHGLRDGRTRVEKSGDKMPSTNPVDIPHCDVVDVFLMLYPEYVAFREDLLAIGEQVPRYRFNFERWEEAKSEGGTLDEDTT